MRALILAAALAVPAASQTAPFSFGGPQEDVAYAVDVAADGSFAIGGLTYGEYDPDPGPADATVPSGGRADGFAAVYAPDDAFRFAVPFGPPGPSAVDEVYDVALGPSGELAVVGQVGETLDLDPGPGVVLIEAPGFAVYVFVALYEPDGTFRAGFTLPGADFEQRGYAAFDASGNLYVAVSVSSPTDLDPGPGEAIVDGFRSAALASYTPAGAFRWGFALNGAQYRARGIDVAGARVALTGTLISGAVDVDPGPAEVEIDGPGVSSWLTATYTTASGALASAFVVGGSNFGGVSEVALDASGALALVGTIDLDADFDPGDGALVVEATGGSNGTGVVAAYNADGTPRFAYGLGSTLPRGVAIDGSRVVYTGHFAEAFDADPGPGEAIVTPVAGFDVVTVSLDDGAFEWASPILGPGTGDNGLGVALVDGRAVATGRFSDTVDADPGPGTVSLASDSRFDYDVFVVGYDRDGTLAARPTTGEARPDDSFALTVGPSPTRSGARVRLSTREATRVEVFDVLGRSVALLHDGPGGDLSLPTPRLAPGVYTIRATDGARGTAASLVVTR